MDNDPGRLGDRAAIVDLSVQYATAVDTLQRSLFEDCFGDLVRVDYSEVSGVPAKTFERAPYASGIMHRMSGYDATQHIITNQVITFGPDGESGTCRAYMQATHLIGDRIWTMGGQYTHDLLRIGGVWRIVGICLTKTWETGDISLATAGRARADGGDSGRIPQP